MEVRGCLPLHVASWYLYPGRALKLVEAHEARWSVPGEELHLVPSLELSKELSKDENRIKRNLRENMRKSEKI